MHPLIRKFLAIIMGIIIGGLVNFGIVALGPAVIPPPEGVDATNMETLKKSMHLFEAKHFLFPLLAHAIGSMMGGLLAAAIVKEHKMRFALGVGVFFFLGGMINIIILPAPTWFIVVDLILAYFPFAWMGGKLAGSL
jgi:hypothetical protein